MPKEQLQFYDALDNPGLALNGLAKQLRYMAATSSVKDNKSYEAFCVGTAQLFEASSRGTVEAGELIIDCFRNRRNTASGHPLTYRGAVELLFRAGQRQFLWPYQSEQMQPYPTAEHKRPDTWRRLPQRLLSDATSREEYARDLKRDVQSNVASRYVAHHLVMHYLGARLGPRPAMLDLGTSDMLGPTKLSSGSPFQKLTIHGVGGAALESKQSANKKINTAAQSRLQVGPIVGVDIVERNTENRRWVLACTLRGDEWEQSHLREEWRTLHEHSWLNEYGEQALYFYRGDITSSEDMARIKRQSPIKKFEVVTMTTMLYQLSPDERLRAQQNAAQFLADNGVMVYQDFCGKDPENPGQLKFFDDWARPFAYRTIIALAEEPSRLYGFANWRTGRCNGLKLGEDFIELTQGVLRND